MATTRSSSDYSSYRGISKPLGSRLLNRLRLFWPGTWWGVAKQRDIDLSALTTSLWGIVVPAVSYPLLVYVVSSITLLSSSHHEALLLPAPDRLVVPYLLSPWTLAMAYRASQPIRNVIEATAAVHKMRSETLPEAFQMLADRIATQRAYRTRKYDVYLPPPPALSTDVRPMDAILFVPGAAVQDVAYAIPTALLSDLGYLVVVLSAEPLRMASIDFGFHANYVRRIQRAVGKRHATIGEWFGVGHSLGSFTLTHIAPDVGFRRVVFWGAAPFIKAMGNLRDVANLDVLVIQGSKDVVFDLVAQTTNLTEAKAQYWNRLPPTSKEHVIEGGTHSGFASYSSRMEVGLQDVLPRDQQHQIVVQMTADFLKR